jgi:hypothetical protein
MDLVPSFCTYGEVPTVAAFFHEAEADAFVYACLDVFFGFAEVFRYEREAGLVYFAIEVTAYDCLGEQCRVAAFGNAIAGHFE